MRDKYVSERFHQALDLASRLHESQCRKSNSAPYISHLLSVASMVFKCNGTEDQAIAALLHDSLEDQSDKISAEQIASSFGAKVKQIVLACTDDHTAARKTIPWRERKQKYIKHLLHLSAEEMLVVVADKLDNVRDLKLNYSQVGETIWQKFSGNKDGMIWYLQQLVIAMRSWLLLPQAHENPYIKDLIAEFIDLSALFTASKVIDKVSEPSENYSAKVI